MDERMDDGGGDGTSHVTTRVVKNVWRNKGSRISNNGQGVCIRCGSVGVKDTFYGKGKQFCSANCVRGLPHVPPQHVTPPKVLVLPKQTKKKPPKITAGKSSPLIPSLFSFDWIQILSDASVRGAPVSSFPHAPMADCWDSLVTIGLKVEVKNRDFPAQLSKANAEYHWIANVLKIAGYMVLLRYEGFASDSSQDFWINLFTTTVHPVGWCASQGKALIPPKAIEANSSDWKGFLVKRLTGSRTLPQNFYDQVKDSLKSRFKMGMKLEVVDKNRISAVRVATVDDIVGGRLHVHYGGAEETDEGFWCHQRSPIIHPVGWAQMVGHELRATPEYARSSLQKVMSKQFDDDDATWNLFPHQTVVPSEFRFKEGMKLEAIDPLNLSTICVATVTKVLRNNYLMIGIDGMMAANGSDWFCYHASSPCIFPVGFCSLNNIELTPPRDYTRDFTWFQYLRESKSIAAPVPLFKKDIPKHGFKEGMFLEAVDLMEPRLICVATVTKVVGRLLRVHFVGWDDSYDQWCDCESPELYPIGWCKMVNYPLEPPKDEDATNSQNVTPNERARQRRGTYGRGRRESMTNQSDSNSFVTGKKRASQSVRDNTSSSPSLASEWITCQDETVSSTSMMTSSNSSVTIKPSPQLLGSDPRKWTFKDVAHFLRNNDCGSYCDAFVKRKIDGETFLSLTREDLIQITHILGPSLKIHALIDSLKRKKTFL